MCKKCGTLCGVIVLIVGVLFLLQDLGVWRFWGLNWYTVLFLIAGIGMIGHATCPECKAMCCPEPAPTKKK